jgi:membrane glycosyltransferase
VVSTVIAATRCRAGPALPPLTGFAAYVHWSYSGEALCLFAYTIALLFLPKALALLDLCSRPGRRGRVRRDGGTMHRRASSSRP